MARLFQKNPEQAAALEGRIVIELDARRGLGRTVTLRGDIDHLARDVEFPAMEDATQRAIFIAGEHQRDTAMRTSLVEKANTTVGSAESDIVLAEQAHAFGCAVGDQRGAERTGNPVALAHEDAHWDIAFDFGKQAVVTGQHFLSPISVICCRYYCRPASRIFSFH